MKRFKVLLCAALLGAATLCAEDAAEGSKPGETHIEMWKWANFAILAVALGYVIAKNAPAMFRGRTAEIQQGISEAQAVKRDAEKRAADMDARMNRLGADVDAFRAQAKIEMEREGDRIRRETAAQVEKIHQQATLEIETAGRTARRELREYAADLALDMASQRIQARMGPEAEAAVFSDFLKDLERQGANN